MKIHRLSADVVPHQFNISMTRPSEAHLQQPKLIARVTPKSRNNLYINTSHQDSRCSTLPSTNFSHKHADPSKTISGKAHTRLPAPTGRFLATYREYRPVNPKRDIGSFRDSQNQNSCVNQKNTNINELDQQQVQLKKVLRKYMNSASRHRKTASQVVDYNNQDEQNTATGDAPRLNIVTEETENRVIYDAPCKQHAQTQRTSNYSQNLLQRHLNGVRCKQEADEAAKRKIRQMKILAKQQFQEKLKDVQQRKSMVTTMIRNQHQNFFRKRLTPSAGLPYFGYMEISQIYSILRKIVECYSHLNNFGHASNKITSMVQGYCNEKKDLEFIFLKVKKHNPLTDSLVFEHKTEYQEIYEALVKLATGKRGKQLDQLINDLIQFKERLEWDIIDRAKYKISDLRKSILNRSKEILHKQYNMGVDYDLPHVRGFDGDESRDAKNSVLAVVEHLKNFEDKNGIYKGISKVNRLLYKQIVETEGDIEDTVLAQFRNYQKSFPCR